MSTRPLLPLLLPLLLLFLSLGASCSTEQAEPTPLEVEGVVGGVQENHRLAFEQLVERCDMEFQLPAGFRLEPGDDSGAFSYEARLVHPEGLVEARLALRPLKDIEIEYQDPHSAAPSPEHLFPLMLLSILQEISLDPESRSEEFGQAAKGEFGADWGQASVHRPREQFSTAYDQMLVLAMHRNRKADAYLVILFDDYATSKEALNRVKQSLRFR